MPAKPKKEQKNRKLPELSQENYGVWEMHVKHCFYAADWLKMYEASLKHPPTPWTKTRRMLKLLLMTAERPGAPSPVTQ